MSHALFAVHYSFAGSNGAVAFGTVIEDTAQTFRTTLDGWRLSHALTIVGFDKRHNNICAVRHSPEIPDTSLVSQFLPMQEGDEVIDRFDIRAILTSLRVEKLEELLSRRVRFVLNGKDREGEVMALSIGYRGLSMRIDGMEADENPIVSVNASAHGSSPSWVAGRIYRNDFYDYEEDFLTNLRLIE